MLKFAVELLRAVLHSDVPCAAGNLVLLQKTSSKVAWLVEDHLQAIGWQDTRRWLQQHRTQN